MMQVAVSTKTNRFGAAARQSLLFKKKLKKNEIPF